MAYSYIRYTGNGTQTDFSFAFPYFSTTNISVTVDGTAAPFTWVNSSTVKITTAPALGAVIFIQRTTPKDITPVNFVDGSVLLEADLDTLALFSLYAAQESIDEANKAIKLNSGGNWEAQGNRITNVADPVNAQDAATKLWSETGMTAQLAIATNQASAASGSATAAASSAAASSASATNSASSASTSTTKAAEAVTSATAAATSATNSAASASTSSTKAAEAVVSATTATTKASEASTSATTASTAAGSANTSATAAAGSATAASNSASGAATSATTATTKASEASSSATSAASSATTATGAASTATTKATEASGSATAAAGSATSAATSATSASSSASTATTKAAEAVVSASDSAASAVSAASSAASAAALLDNFDDRYLGAKSSAPSVDNDGNALQLGALYFDSTTGKMRVYTASGWLDASSASVATLAVFNYTATASQTSFSGADIASQTLTYTVGSLFVTLNGIDLKNGTDYTATTGSSIVLASGAAAGDELRVYAFGSFLVADTYTRAQVDTSLAAKVNKSGDTMSGNLSLESVNNIKLSIKATDGGNDRNATLELLSSGNGGSVVELIYGDTDTTADTKSPLVIKGYHNGTLTERMRIDSSGRVTMPYQPSFDVGRSGNITSTQDTFTKVAYNQSFINRGNGFNVGNGTFTAPIAGVYTFNINLFCNKPASTARIDLGIYKNGANVRGHEFQGMRTDVTVNTGFNYSFTCELAVNDYIEIFTRCFSNTGLIYGDQYFNRFSGFLVG